MYLAEASVATGVIQQVVSGLASGAVYASLALALVLIYRAMETLNFAQGEMAMFSTFIAWTLITQLHINYYLAFVATIAISIAGGYALERTIVRPVEKSPPLTQVLVFLGLFFAINGLAGLLWQYLEKSFPSPPGFPQAPIGFGGVSVGIQELFLIGVTLVVLAILFVFFRYTKLGLAMRSAALYPESSRLLGVRTSSMLALGWGLAAGVGAVSGMLIAPIEFLDPNMMQPVLLYALTAAVLGGIDNPVGAVVGGFLVGVLLAVIGTYVPGARDLRLAFSLVIIVAVLLVKPGGLFGRAHVVRV